MAESDLHLAQRQLAERVRCRRRQLGLTQEEAARAIGVATRHFQKLEAGELNVTLRTLTRVAHALGVGVGDLFSDLPLGTVDGSTDTKS